MTTPRERLEGSETVKEMAALQAAYKDQLRTRTQLLVADFLRSEFEQGFDFDGEAITVNGKRISAVRWLQYTPYFNDGDTCVFSAHLDEPPILVDGEWINPGWGEGGEEWNHYAPYIRTGEHDRWGNWRSIPDPDWKPSPEGEAYMKLSEIVGSLYAVEDGLHEVFGDHVQVTFHFIGDFHVEEYADHD